MAVAFIIALFADVLDATIVNVALPTLGRELDVGNDVLQWVVTGYLLSLAVWIPASGWLGDRFGTKRIFLLALSIFIGGSALCGLAWSVNALIAFRVLQGVGGGMLTPVGTTMLVRAFPRASAREARRSSASRRCSRRCWARSSAATWWTVPAGAGFSSSICPSACLAWRSRRSCCGSSAKLTPAVSTCRASRWRRQPGLAAVRPVARARGRLAISDRAGLQRTWRAARVRAAQRRTASTRTDAGPEAVSRPRLRQRQPDPRLAVAGLVGTLFLVPLYLQELRGLSAWSRA